MNKDFEYMSELDIFNNDEPQEVKNKAKGVLESYTDNDYADDMLLFAMGADFCDFFEESC